MATVAARGTGTPATTGTTWATTTNAVDGAAGTNPATYTTLTSTTSAAVATIEVTGYGFSSSIGASDTLNSVTVSLRHFENNTGRFASVTFQAFDGATAIGTATTATLATAARNDTATPAVTLAQLRSSTFKIRVTITGAASTQSRVESIDYVDVTADYTPLPPAITQAAYRFYADDTGAATLADSYATGTSSFSPFGATGANSAMAQSFTGNGGRLQRATFVLQRIGSPVGNISAALYAHSGTFGSGGIPTGTALATSTNTKDAATLPAATASETVTFTFDETYTLTNGTAYFIAVSGTGLGDGSNVPRINVNASGTHAGNGASFTSPTWTSTSADRGFEVYTTSSEANSTALAAQDTGYTADTSAGDVNLQVRVRLQSTNAVTVPATDDWQLQWEKNTSGTWNSVGVLADTLATSVATSNYAVTSTSLIPPTTGFAQSFQGDGKLLSRVGFYVHKTGTPAGNIWSSLYAHTGTYGSTGTPTGSPLATSALRAASSVSSSNISVPAMEYFVFAGAPTLVNGTSYCVTIESDGGAASDAVSICRTTAGSTHSGNLSLKSSGSWGFTSSDDRIFEVYTGTAVSTVDGYNSANLTDAAATTNRLGSGSGSFIAGKVSEDGLVDDVGWSANNYTELLYSVTLKQADLAPTDTVRFRVLRNGATTGLTYTATPTITIGTAGPTDRTGVATGVITVAGTSTGVRDTLGAASSSLTVAGTAAGAPGAAGTAVVGTATGAVTVSGVSVGVRGTPATATGTLTVVGVSAGVRPMSGVGTAAVTLTGTSTGSRGTAGTATGVITVSSAAVGTVTVTATASSTLTVSGVATGLHGIAGTAAGAIALAGAGSGQVTVTATASSTITLTGTASGVKTVGGAATGTIVVSSLVLGLVEGNAVGTATGQLTVGGLATGTKNVTALATGVITLISLAVGRRGTTGTATGHIDVDGTGTGSGASPGGVVTIIGEWNDQETTALQWGALQVVDWYMLVPTAVTGVGTGILTVTASAVGVRDTPGVAAGAVTVTGAATGTVTAAPTSGIASYNTEIGISLGTPNSFPAPAGVVSGNLLVCVATQRNAGAMTASTGWTQVMQVTQSSSFRVAVWARIADGGANDTFTVTGGGATADYCALIMRIAAHGVTAIGTDIKQANTGANSANADPPSLDTGTSRSWLWLAVMTAGAGGGSHVTGVPANYTQVVNLESDVTTGAAMHLVVAERTLTAQTEDPGTFTSPLFIWNTTTLAIRL